MLIWHHACILGPSTINSRTPGKIYPHLFWTKFLSKTSLQQQPGRKRRENIFHCRKDSVMWQKSLLKASFWLHATVWGSFPAMSHSNYISDRICGAKYNFPPRQRPLVKCNGNIIKNQPVFMTSCSSSLSLVRQFIFLGYKRPYSGWQTNWSLIKERSENTRAHEQPQTNLSGSVKCLNKKIWRTTSL